MHGHLLRRNLQYHNRMKRKEAFYSAQVNTNDWSNAGSNFIAKIIEAQVGFIFHYHVKVCQSFRDLI